MNIRIAMAILLFAAATIALSAQSGMIPAPQIAIKAIETPNIGLHISKPSMHADHGRNIYGLTFKVKNNNSDDVKHARFLLLSVAGDGRIKGGESFCEKNLMVGKAQSFSVPLAGKFGDAGDHGVLAVLDVAYSNGRRGTVSAKDIVEANSVNRDSTPDAIFSASVSPENRYCPGFCKDCRNIALETCGAGRVKSFSCSETTCTCSFTCQ